jgi:pentatricopeptide repeat domain-containing protein 1
MINLYMQQIKHAMHDWKRVLKLLEEMQSQGLKPDVKAYTIAIHACSKANRPEQAVQLLEEMRRHGVEPNVISYSAAISACGKGARPDQAVQLLQEM